MIGSSLLTNLLPLFMLWSVYAIGRYILSKAFVKQDLTAKVNRKRLISNMRMNRRAPVLCASHAATHLRVGHMAIMNGKHCDRCILDKKKKKVVS